MRRKRKPPKSTLIDEVLRLPKREQHLKKCVIKGCASSFWGTEDLKYCARHRSQYVRIRAGRVLPESDIGRSEWDWRVIDENGKEVWALDLAQRYRKELIRRKTRDWTTNRH